MADNTDGLASWIMERVNSWEDWRKQNYDQRWNEYYRLWRGLWTEGDKNRAGERSRIICPELAQSVETCVAELEDATFIRDRFIDVKEDISDEKKQEEMDKYVRQLLDDYAENGVPQAISEVYFNAALYGTGIAKVVIDKAQEPIISEGDLPSISFVDKYSVKVVPIAPRNFVIDPLARSVKEALGCAHVLNIPLAAVQKKIADGTYKKIDIISSEKQVDDLRELAEYATGAKSDFCKVVEYHGFVPKRFISPSEKLFDGIQAAINDISEETTIKSTEEDGELIEAIVTIINDDQIARAVKNPFIFGDRSIIAYQHDTVPNRFWGRGVAEKGYNPQKALDAEIRARIDALGLSTHPMMGIDATKIPRGERFEVRPGRNILTNGPPQEALFPLKFSPPDPYTFNQSQELREMIQRATGGYELPAMMNDANRMAATSMSMVVGSMIKRSRRTLANIERELIIPMVNKSLWRYMQFDPERYPMKDYKFRVRATTGIMAREFEQGQMISLLSNVPQESPAFWMLIKGIFENSSIDSREYMVQFADSMLKQAENPQPPPPDPKVQADLAKLEFEKAKHADLMDLEAAKLIEEKKRTASEVKKDIAQADFDKAMGVLELMKAENEKQKTAADTFSKVATAYSSLITAKANEIKAIVSAVTPVSTGSTTQTNKNESSSTSTSTETMSTPIEKIEELEEEIEEVLPEDKLATVLDKLSNVLEGQISGINAHSETIKNLKVEPQDNSEIINLIKELSDKLDSSTSETEPALKGMKIDRDSNGLVTHVNGKKITRDNNGLISGMEE